MAPHQELLIHSPPSLPPTLPDFLSLSCDANPLPPLPSFLLYIYFVAWLSVEWALWRITLPGCNPIKKGGKKEEGEKSRNWFLIFVRCCIFPQAPPIISEKTQPALSVIWFTPSKKGTQSSSGFRPREAWLARGNPIEGRTLCICLRFGNN